MYYQFNNNIGCIETTAFKGTARYDGKFNNNIGCIETNIHAW